MGSKPGRYFWYYHFRMSCPGLWTDVEIWRRAVQLCPDRHPAVSSMELWESVQTYPACAVASEFADVENFFLAYLLIGFRTGTGKSAVFLKWVTRVRVR
jgi:hypothetical protein